MKAKKKENEKVGIRNWITFILIGFAGQLAWNVENMYLNKFIFSFGGSDYTSMITITVAVSAIVACLTTIFMGALSDKLNKRKIFISVGYILWGLSTCAFGFISVENVAVLFPAFSASTVASILVIVFDAIMTFFGSTANDAAFNSYVTKNVKPINRGKVEGVLSTLPLLAMALIFGALDSFTSSTPSRWDIFFFIVGGFALVVGLISIFLIKKEKKTPKKEKGTYLKTLLEAFKIKTIKENKGLYLALLAYLLYGISTQIFFPYLIIYFQNSLEISGIDFIIALGVILLVSSILTVLFGIIMDKVKYGKLVMLIPSILILSIGCLLVYFVQPNDLSFGITAGAIMIFGYIFVSTVLNTLVRDSIPKEKEGIFMGVRMIFVVMLPMVIGPYIGQFITDNFATSTYIGEYGTVQNLPPALIWLVSSVATLLILVPVIIYLVKFYKIHTKNDDYFNYGITYKIEKEEKENLLNIHPLPSFKRKDFLSLNGYWEFEVNETGDIPRIFTYKIRVPYSPESPLSEVKRFIKPNEYMFYKKIIKIPPEFNKEHVFLHFLGVDQVCEVFINNESIYKNESGFISFSVDLAKYIENEEVEVILKVVDKTDNDVYSRGKQKLRRGGIWYTSTSGIFKSVYLDSAPTDYISSFDINTDYDKKEIRGIINATKSSKAKILIEDKEFEVDANKEFSISLKEIHEWNLDDPYLYDIKLIFENDEVSSFISFRKIEKKKDENGVNRIYLNNKKIYLKGVLDQGYYFKGNLTPSSYNDFEKDIKNIKELGFNTLRIHAKTEEDIFYYLADKEGILILQDIVNGGGIYKFFVVSTPVILPYKKGDDLDINYQKFSRVEYDGRKEYVNLLKHTIASLKLHPSVIGYTLFNEGWGEFDSTSMYLKAKKLDPSRVYDTNSGWYDNTHSDFISKHIYFTKIKNFSDENRCSLLSEFGGYSLYLKDHFYGEKPFGYKKFKSKERLTKAYKDLMEKVYEISKENLIGFIYTQVSDVEDEVNGLYTFDRKELKLIKEEVININKKFDDFIEK